MSAADWLSSGREKTLQPTVDVFDGEKDELEYTALSHHQGWKLSKWPFLLAPQFSKRDKK